MNSDDIKKAIKKNGFRITKARTAIIEMFCIMEHPINAQYIQTKLSESKIIVNKTTVYRELQFLIERNLIKSVQLTSDTLSYELADRAHHHHIVCINCGKIEKIILRSEKFLDDVKKQTNFELHSHSLEFYGQCTTCK